MPDGPDVGNTGAVELGGELGRGVRSVVVASGGVDAVKIANPSTPDSWLDTEFRLMDAVERAGAPVPGRRRLVEVAGRPAISMERVVGTSMWELLEASPDQAAQLGCRLAEIQADLARCRPSYELPRQRDRLATKVIAAARRYGDDLLEALDLLVDDGEPLVVCHGDLHPRNVMFDSRGPVLVDWYDASRGVIAGEIARTALVLQSSRHHGVSTVSDAALAVMRGTYLAEACRHAGVTSSDVERWLLVQEVARLSEGLGDGDVAEVRSRLERFDRRHVPV